jgi:hypothetical protein
MEEDSIEIVKKKNYLRMIAKDKAWDDWGKESTSAIIVVIRFLGWKEIVLSSARRFLSESYQYHDREIEILKF